MPRLQVRLRGLRWTVGLTHPGAGAASGPAEPACRRTRQALLPSKPTQVGLEARQSLPPHLLDHNGLPETISEMDAQQVLSTGQQGLTLLLMVSAPVLLVVLVVGLLVSIFQAATQINEATLSFVPKIIAAVAVLGIAGPWMVSTLVEYIQRMLLSIPGAVG